MDQTFHPAQPQFIVMPVPQRNALGVLGFFVALIGLVVPTGIIALLGLLLSLAAIGRSPRGFATMGVILGLLGSAFWLGVMLVAIVGALVVAIGAALLFTGAFVLVHPEVVEITSDMANVVLAVEEYRQEKSAMPDEVGALALGVAATIDPWGATYRLAAVDDDSDYDIISGGPDRAFDTDDDVRLSSLDRTWEEAFDSFGDRMERFGEQMERLDRRHEGECDGADVSVAEHPVFGRWPGVGRASAYERAAVEDVEEAEETEETGEAEETPSEP